MQIVPQWLWSFFGGSDDRPSRAGQDRFTEREADLQRRFERLSREVDVVQRAETGEERE